MTMHLSCYAFLSAMDAHAAIILLQMDFIISILERLFMWQTGKKH
jgi:hypothetical protein